MSRQRSLPIFLSFLLIFLSSAETTHVINQNIMPMSRTRLIHFFSHSNEKKKRAISNNPTAPRSSHTVTCGRLSDTQPHRCYAKNCMVVLDSGSQGSSRGSHFATKRREKGFPPQILVKKRTHKRHAAGVESLCQEPDRSSPPNIEFGLDVVPTLRTATGAHDCSSPPNIEQRA